MTPLQQAATALLDAMVKTDFTCRLGNQLDALEKALEAEQAQAVEPIGYIRHADKTFWPHPECAVYASVSPSLVPVYAHPAPPVEQAQGVEPKLPELFSEIEWLGSEVRAHVFQRRADQTPLNVHSSTHPAPPVEQAQAVEHVATVRSMNGVTFGYLDVMQPVGTKLYLHPAPLVTKPDSLPDSPPSCNPHPDAPHGFDRNASHSAGRYVCDCEGWIQDWSAAPQGAKP